MDVNPLVKLSAAQVAAAKLQIESLDKILKNSAALIDSGVMIQEQITQAKDTKDIITRTIKAYPQE